MNETAQKAIRAALECRWSDALNLNHELLKDNPSDIDTLNRISKAYFELGKNAKAILYCKKVLKIDQLNSIANKNLEKFTAIKSNRDGKKKLLNPHIFLEIPGKTRIVDLINISDNYNVADFDPGTEVRIHTGGFRVSVYSQDGQYIGKMRDDVSRTIIHETSNKIVYGAWIKDCSSEHVRIFVKQTNTTNSEK